MSPTGRGVADLHVGQCLHRVLAGLAHPPGALNLQRTRQPGRCGERRVPPSHDGLLVLVDLDGPTATSRERDGDGDQTCGRGNAHAILRAEASDGPSRYMSIACNEWR